MQSVGFPKRRAIAEAVEQGARTHGLVYRGPGRRAWEERARPVLQDQTDAIVRITTTTICGTDLHILKVDVPSVKEGRTLGHEGIGVVTDVGAVNDKNFNQFSYAGAVNGAVSIGAKTPSVVVPKATSDYEPLLQAYVDQGWGSCSSRNVMRSS